jgi:hypothetical protein
MGIVSSGQKKKEGLAKARHYTVRIKTRSWERYDRSHMPRKNKASSQYAGFPLISNGT